MYLHSMFVFVSSQQDFLWFCVLLGWIAAGCLIHLHRHTPAFAAWCLWLRIIAICGALLATGEIVLHSLPPQVDYVEQLHWDVILSALHTVQAFALIAILPVAGPRGRRWRWLLAAITAGIWVGRLYAFVNFDAVLLSLGLLLAIMLPRKTGWSGLIWLCTLAPLVATTGLLAEVMGVSRRWVELSPFALPAALWQFATASVAIAKLGRKYGWIPGAGADTPVPVELKLFLRVSAVWLGLGLLLAIWTGRQAGRAFQESLLSRVRAAALTIDPKNAGAILTSDMDLQAPDLVDQPGGRKGRIFHVPALVESALPLRLQLTQVQKINPDIYWSMFLTLRGGYLLAAALPQHLPAHKDVVVVVGPVSPRDQSSWDTRTAFFEEPYLTDYGEVVRARAPIVGDRDQMLGWLAFEIGASYWSAAQAVARLQTLSLVGLGVVLALFIMLRRLARQERERIELAAAGALEADRAKTAFLAKVSHELRTPVQSILGYSELLAGQSLPPECHRWLGSVRSQGQLLIRLVNDLIDLSALQSGAFRMAPQSANLPDLVRNTADSLAPRAAAKDLALVVETSPALPPWLRFDAERVRQVLLNLIGNAIKFTPLGGIRVRLSVTSRPGDAITAVELAVTDTGPGIPPEEQVRLFRPFTRLQRHETVEGAGLGLALSAAICQSMGGSLRLESDGIHGCTFIVVLPLPLAEPPASPPVWSPPVGLAGLRVLVADDNPLVRELFSTSLRQAGVWVDLASDGLEAVELCAKQSYSAVVLDVSMPWLNGFEAARRIRAVSRDKVRIIGVSAHAGAGDRSVAEAAGMETLLVKPLSIGELLNAVAGTANRPSSDDRTTPGDLGLLRRLRQQFAEEAPRLAAELQEALASSDRRWLRTRAHYVKNSADVSGFPEISLLCTQIEIQTTDDSADPGPATAELINALRPSPALSTPANLPGQNPTQTP